ncbi:MAG TPA: MFS transporter [Rhodospirillales bacterium]|jgi:cyanate permease|nr:MFS transporter [Rhodospirillales bacterium]
MLGGVWLVYYCFGLQTAAMAPLVKPVTDDLGLSYSAMGAVLGAWQLVYIATALPCGAFLDRVGLRRALFMSALIMAASGALRALAVDHLTLFLAVALFGFGGPLISIGAPKLISQWFVGDERGLAMGLYITGPSLGNITALALTNSVLMPLADGNWRFVLATYAAFALGAGIVWLAISSHEASRTMETTVADRPKQNQLQIFTDLVRLRPVRIMLVMSIGIFFFNHALSSWLPEILRSGGMDAKSAGYWSSVPTAVGIIGALLIPRLAIPSRRLTILFLLFVGAASASLLLQSGAGFPLAMGLVMQGLARSSMMTVSLLVLMEMRDVDSRNMGAAGGLFFSAAEIGGVLGPLTIGSLSDLTGGFVAGLYLLTGISVALMVLLWTLRRDGGANH